MKTILLLRHAKSDWGDRNMADIDRPLNRRGQAAAPVMAAWIAAHDLCPDVILCSTARRTRETLALVRPALKGKVPEVLDEGLYLAEVPVLLDRLRGLDDGVGTVLLIAHNPGLEDLAAELSSFAGHMPTAGLVVLQFDVAAWTEITSGGGKLHAFVTPKGLQQGTRHEP
jgi:phosphohistidine phosphatase